jgi:predicted DNA-binding transcriptional regulator AlpA
MSATVTANRAPNDLPEPRFLRAPQVLAMVPISAPTLWRMVKAGRFPAPCKLAPNVTAWRLTDVQAWCDGIQPNSN